MIKMTDDEFRFLTGFLKQKFGINLENKRVLLEGRLNSYFLQNGYNSYAEYISILKTESTGKELTNLLNRVTTNHTYFMREIEHFEFLSRKVLPELEARVRNREIRVWCAASSTGEEPYTLAMVLHDHFGRKTPGWDKSMLATDISQRVLEHAKQGIYTEESIEKIPESWRRRYFTPEGPGMVRVVPEIRSQVIYRTFNLMEPIKFKGKFHVIFCRNVMIYFDAPTKAALAERMHDALYPGGYLFVGQTESVAKSARFEYVMPSVYVKGQ